MRISGRLGAVAKSDIEWCDYVWNFLRGCSRESPGCEHCYAERQAHRFSGPGGKYEGLTVLSAKGSPRWTGQVRFIESKLTEPLKLRKPRRIFVDSMSDLFHPSVSLDTISMAFAVMAACPQHTFIVLTKRAKRMREFFEWVAQADADGTWPLHVDKIRRPLARLLGEFNAPKSKSIEWPLPNIWLGVSVEDQQRANERIPNLLETPAAVRFLSVEPMLGPVDLTDISAKNETGVEQWDCLEREFNDYTGVDGPRIDWVILGAESGPDRRQCQGAWILDVAQACEAHGVPCFIKQLEIDGKISKEPSEWPLWARVQQFPKARHG